MAARRSSRLKAKEATSAAQVSKPSTPASDIRDLEDADDARPARKRQRKNTPASKTVTIKTTPARKTAVTVKIKGGRLKMLAEMPVDVLLEIFSHLPPVDVLHLAWTSRELRSVLMRRSAISVWRGAFDAMPYVPECPADQTLPQWARLLFVPHCHLCLAPSVTTILFTLRMRVCQKCLSSRGDIFVTRIGDGLDASLYEAGLRLDESYCPSSRIKVGSGRRESWQPVYLLAHIKDTKVSALEVLKDGEKALKAFLAEKRTTIHQMKQHARLCDKWYEEQREGRAGQLLRIRSERKAGIVEKLKQLGYEADINYVRSHRYDYDFENHALVRKSQKLTPKVWSNIQQTIVDYVLGSRPQRLADERKTEMARRGRFLKEVLAKYRASLPSDAHIPPDGDIADSAPFRSVWDIDPHSKVCAKDFDAALATIPDLYEPWSAAVDSSILKMLDASEPSILQLATSLFVCRYCRATVLPCDARGHACPGTRRTTYTHYADEERERLLYQFYNALDSAPWNQWKSIRAPTDDVQSWIRPCMEGLVRACGLDPMTATHSDMDAADATFTCVWCTEDLGHCYTQGQKPMNWNAAIRHHVDFHAWREKPPSFVRTTPADEAVQAQVEQGAPAQ